MKEMKEIVQETDSKKQQEKYNQYVKEKTPKHNWFKNACVAYLVGGIICLLGEVCKQWLISLGLSEEEGGLYTTLILIFLSILFTGLGWYQKLAKHAGAGTIVPITGFANSVAAPAIEYQKEGQVFGVGCKIFTIAGPVILYGIFTSWCLGLLLWVLQQMGWR